MTGVLLYMASHDGESCADAEGEYARAPELIKARMEPIVDTLFRVSILRVI